MTTKNSMATFAAIWAGQFVSTLGSSLAAFAIGVWVYETTGSATQFSITLLASSIASVGLAPLTGAIADRWDRRLVMLLSDTGAALSSIVVLIMLLTGNLKVWHIYLTAFTNSACGAFQWPAYAATTSLLVPKEHLGRASGMTRVGHAVGKLAAPAIAGALFVTAGLRTILIIDIATYLVALATLSAVRFPNPAVTEEEQGPKSSIWKESLFGWTYIRQRSGLLGLLVTYAFLNFFLCITLALYTPLILGITTPDILGYLNSVGALGMLVGSLVMSAWGGPKRRILGIYAGETVIGLATLFLGLPLSVPMMALSTFFSILAMPISGGCNHAIWQSKVRPDIQGRVFAIQGMIIDAGVPLAYLVAGPLAEGVFEPGMAAGGSLARLFGPLVGVGPGRGIALIFVIAGGINALISLAVLVHPRIRRVEFELADAIA